MVFDADEFGDGGVGGEEFAFFWGGFLGVGEGEECEEGEEEFHRKFARVLVFREEEEVLK